MDLLVVFLNQHTIANVTTMEFLGLAYAGLPESAVDPVVFIDADERSSAAVTKNGNLYTWGNNNYGQLGLGHREPCPQPTLVDSLVGQVGTVSMGSMYCGAVLRNGRLAMWGHGGHGNLGLGDRKDRTRPCTVGGLLSDAVVVQVACTRGQNGCKGGRRPKTGGAEGPHTIALTAHGRLYTFGVHARVVPVFVVQMPPPPPSSTCLTRHRIHA
eukprot:m.510280 g.510280  ORF g.510280 m.510280 type:complete len:213 (+) comp21889_c0_seq47:1307-1945(+)